ncbi:MAG: gliding motility-associated-like protein [Luteibaculaceae bacterium]|jgi:gliding motility-associated-like protein
MYCRIVCFLTIFWAQFTCLAQFDVSYGGNQSDPQWLVENVLSGEGVTISGVKSYGYPSQFGYFNKGAELLGMESGVVLSNGKVEDIFPQDQRMNHAYQVSPTGGDGDDDLLAIANLVPDLVEKDFSVNRTKDAAILEFDFISISDSVEFSFVFASEEYAVQGEQGFLFSKFNDVFGFFVAGPGISGPYSSPNGFPNGSANLATIPENEWPITVSTVNNVFNSNYFVQTGDGKSPNPYNGQSIRIQKSFEVTPCEVYHFRFAIADGQDNTFDSGVFLEEGSFKIKREIVEFTNDKVNGNRLFEGCSSFDLVVNLPAVFATEQRIQLNFSGISDASAPDFDPWPTELIIEAGVRSKSFSIPVLDDWLSEGTELFQVELTFESGCVPNITSPIFTLEDYEPIVTNFVQSPPQLDCPNVPFSVEANSTGGLGEYQEKWMVNGSVVDQDSILELSQLENGQIIFEIVDNCGSPYYSEYFPKIRAGSTPSLDSIPDYSICISDTLEINPVVTGGYGQNTVLWNPFGIEANPLVLDKSVLGPLGSTTVKAELRDECGLGEDRVFFIEVVDPSASFDYSFYNDFHMYANNTSSGNYSDLFWRLDGQIISTGTDRLDFRLEELKDYFLEVVVSDNAGCSDSYGAILEYPIQVYIPNTFSPNGDGYNEIFQVISDQEFSAFDFRIFDRAGQQIFFTKSQYEGWDGRLPGGARAQSTNVFIWELKLDLGSRYSRTLNGVILVL